MCLCDCYCLIGRINCTTVLFCFFSTFSSYFIALNKIAIVLFIYNAILFFLFLFVYIIVLSCSDFSRLTKCERFCLPFLLDFVNYGCSWGVSFLFFLLIL